MTVRRTEETKNIRVAERILNAVRNAMSIVIMAINLSWFVACGQNNTKFLGVYYEFIIHKIYTGGTWPCQNSRL